MMMPSWTTVVLGQYLRMVVHATISNGTMAASYRILAQSQHFNMSYIACTRAGESYEYEKVPPGGDTKALIDKSTRKSNERGRYWEVGDHLGDGIVDAQYHSAPRNSVSS
jgi:hypothetical protein